MLKSFNVQLGNQKSVQAVRIAEGTDLEGLAEALALPPRNGVIALVGGAKQFDYEATPEMVAGVEQALSELTKLASAHQLAVVDGGTPSGVMRLMGEARASSGAEFPLVGVPPVDKVTWADRKQGEGGSTPLDWNHSAFVLVESNEWGGESETLAAVAHALAGEGPVLEVVINGGDVTREDVWNFLKRGGNVVVVQGSGRVADQLAAALKRGSTDIPGVQRVLDTRRAHIHDLASPPGVFGERLMTLGNWHEN